LEPKNQSFRNKSGIAQPIRTKFGIAIRGQVKGDNVQGILGAISPFWAKWGGAENAGQDIAGQDNDGQTSMARLCRTGQ